MNNITIELCAEDRARIDNLTAALEKFHDVVTIKLTPEQTQSMAALAEQAGATLKPAEAPKAEGQSAGRVPMADPEIVPTPTPEPVTGAPEEEPDEPVTLQDVRDEIIKLTAAGKKDACRDIVMKYAPKVSDIPEDKLAEVMKELKKLEG